MSRRRRHNRAPGRVLEPPRKVLSGRLLDEYDAELVQADRRVYRVEVTVTETRIVLVDARSEEDAVSALTGGKRRAGVILSGEGSRKRSRQVRCLGRISQPLDDPPAA